MKAFTEVKIKTEDDSDSLKKKNSVTKNKRGRVIIRNLSYQATEEKVSNFFKGYGDIEEVSLLKLPNGKLKGVAFVQFKQTLSALKAIRDCNMKLFMGRPVVVDMAVPKCIYTNPQPGDQVKVENTSSIKDEKTGDKKPTCRPVFVDLAKPQPGDQVKVENSPSIKEEKNKDKKPTSQCASRVTLKEEPEDSDSDSGSDSDSSFEKDSEEEEDKEDEEEEEEEIEDSTDNEENSEVKSENKRGTQQVDRPKSTSRDVREGRTLFLRNVSVDATEEQILNRLSRFGLVKQVSLCRDHVTKRFKGTAFAQFLVREGAEKCLEASSDPAFRSHFTFGGRVFVPSEAMSREDAEHKNMSKKKLKENDAKDKRNIYLAREGVIREGTRPAQGVSKSDLARRVEREIMKRKMLANLSVFVSPVRLFVCNLPLELTDKELRNIFRKYSLKEAVITECRIMRNLYELDDTGQPVSKGHGFVTFTVHEHALEALRSINNNPNIFTKTKRPIVEFSLENKAALTAKERRNEKMKELHPRKVPKLGHKKQSGNTREETPSFMGSSYECGAKGTRALHSHIGPKIRSRSNLAKRGGKITRNKINNQMRQSRGKKRKREPSKFGLVKTKTRDISGTSKNRSQSRTTNDSTKKPKLKRRKFIS